MYNISRSTNPLEVKRRQQLKLPDLGGMVTVAIVETHAPIQTGPGPARSSKQRVIARLQQKSKLSNATPSDEVEGLKFEIRWEPAKGALGVAIPSTEALLAAEVLFVVCIRRRRGVYCSQRLRIRMILILRNYYV